MVCARLRPFLSGLFIGCLVWTGVLGCSSDPPSSRGVVARVNAEPIYLSQVQAVHDLHFMDWSLDNDFKVHSLQDEYGAVLADFVLHRLIRQTLIREGLQITEKDVDREERIVRSDYPDEETFEQALVEDYIDLDQWRRCIRARLSTQAFIQDYLRPKVSISYEAAREYYREHIADYVIPERFVFTVFLGMDREGLGTVLEEYRAQGDAFSGPSVEGVEVHEMEVARNGLSPFWSDALADLEPGRASGIISDKQRLVVLYLHERLSPSYLAPSKAYRLVEEMLVEQELRGAFRDWLRDELATATIEVSTSMVPRTSSVDGRTGADKDLTP
ncbi:peptidylprolyl isomerase [Desulfoplanes sp.]